MITTTTIVEEIIKDSPLLEEGLIRGIISYSAVAREIRPHIEKKLIKTVQRGAIVMALRRISKTLQKKQKIPESVYSFADLTVRSRLIECTFNNSDTIAEKQRKLFSVIENRRDIFCNFSQGVRETTLIVSKDIQKELEHIFRDEKLLTKITDLSSITIRFHKEIVHISGMYYFILKLIAWENISVIEVVSTATELTIIFRTADVDKAFSILKNVKYKR